MGRRHLAQRDGERVRVAKAIVGVNSQRPIEHDLQVAGQARTLTRERWHRLGVNLIGRRVQIAAVDALADESLVEADPEREEIAARVDRLIVRHLGRHVADLAAHPVKDRRIGHGLGDAEVGQLHLPFPGTENVRRREVAVDDTE